MPAPAARRIRFCLALALSSALGAAWLGALEVEAQGSAPSPALPAAARRPATSPDAGRCANPPAAWVPPQTGGPQGESIGLCLRRLGRGKTDARIPPDQSYVLTTFGGPGDEQPVDCQDPRGADGKWYYAANLQRFPCGQKVRLVDAQRRRCVVVEVADTGPHICVEQAGGRPMWDVSPLASLHLFGVRSTGWSSARGVYGAPVAASNALGPCDAQLQDAAQISRGSVGGACADVGECGFEGARCLAADAGWPGGYCSAPCSGACPSLAGPHSLAVCSRLDDGSSTCLSRCDFTLHASGCREGYRCASAPGLDPAVPNQVCLPDRCESDSASLTPAPSAPSVPAP